MSINPLIGIPFVDGGRGFDGCDCWGLVMLASKVLYGKQLPDYQISCFASPFIDRAARRDLASSWEKVYDPEEGAIVVMPTDPNAPDLITHIGLIIGPNKMLHTMKKQGSHVERLDHPFYKNKIRGFYVLK